MVTSHSLRLALAGAFAASTVFAHPLQHVHAHAKRQTAPSLDIVWVTIYQTQAAGPGGEPKTFTVLSPMWANAAPTGDGAPTGNFTLPAPTSLGVDSTVPASTATPTLDASLALEVFSTLDASSTLAGTSTPVASLTPSSSSAAGSSVVAGQFAEKQISHNPTPTVLGSTIARTSAVSPPSTSSPAGSPSTGGSGGKADGSKTQYSGVPSEYPPQSSWISFDALFEASKGDPASKGMLSYGLTEANMKSLKDAVQTASKAGGVDPRITFAIVMQESHGDPVKAGAGGIMQCDGCPTGSWSTMPEAIQGGVKHYNACAQKFPQSQPWAALRCYNSGEQRVNLSNLNLGGGATDSYVNDIANRLAHGWVI